MQRYWTPEWSYLPILRRARHRLLAAISEVILLSVLRSPAIPANLHEPEFYSMTEYDGMRDAGEHDFAYAITAYDRPFSESSVVFDAEAYNATPVITAG